MARTFDMVRAESTYTFGSLVRASAGYYLPNDSLLHNQIFYVAGITYRIIGTPVTAFDIWRGSPSEHYDVAAKIVHAINGTGEVGVDYTAAMDTPNPLVSAYYDASARILWFTWREYGPVDPQYILEVGTTGMTLPNGPQFTGDRGMSEGDYVRIGSHNYRFVSEIGEQEDRVLLKLDESEEVNVEAMRDWLLAAIRADPSGSGIYFGANTRAHAMVKAEAGDEHDEIKLVCTVPGNIGNEVQVKDSGDGAFSGGDVLHGGSGDFQEWVGEFVRVNDLKSSAVEELNRMTMRRK